MSVEESGNAPNLVALCLKTRTGHSYSLRHKHIIIYVGEMFLSRSTGASTIHLFLCLRRSPSGLLLLGRTHTL